MKNIIFGAMAVMILLCGCNKQEAKTKEYYDQHLEEAQARVGECKKLEKFNETQQLDCQNANEAVLDNKANRTNPYSKSNPNALKIR
ncbi:EexN family lipoprotein [Campylobacter ureolyticus]|uniref:EexN family lipoprotein n=1 Tax=Campylobacter ureolyticus TaxID=827 RepID=A0A9Q4KLX7_9BACT|nr:EexN family lipoprotein [Campylobacter ureolyticus]MCZ6160497.1 EexN family lipoprotein [Campylobacter ureolyticus]MCZ6164240.1 EexN family lipoprotein [Campylobacter ureolyticus]MCZ6166285.1 EexN family lipoprotein [Campylobacter ureolyticus]MCZ6167955.1 EexN family lipoprotein [Campylobacter ureolyticus]MCZ6186882.1 EexN family lipoprotein [Campylobacter ureolyticus]